ncbi:MAG TPA: D-aminoacyl-tRNA deacylase [Patescibacteria group bacterium]|nr:D-aminoacyl-tRNA deacylase [Patescibacteria group bacterium]
MKLIIQRVNRAKVIRVAEVTGQIDKGLFVLVGVKKGDTTKQAEELANKLVKLRIMSDENEKMNLNLVDAKGKILAVSQFTLYANTKDGNRPSFLDAETPDKAKVIYEHFVKIIKNLGIDCEIGSFGNYMKIDTELDGPVTIVLEN